MKKTNIQKLKFILKGVKLKKQNNNFSLKIHRKLKKPKISEKDKKLLYDELVLGNLRFVISVAKMYQNQGLDILDLISEGNIGLIKAAERFEPSSGYKFISYAVWWVKQSIMASLNENSRIIRIPSNIIQD